MKSIYGICQSKNNLTPSLFLVSNKMHFFDVNQAKNSENDVKIASDKVEGLESGRVLSEDPTNPVDRPHTWYAPSRNRWMLFHEKMT